MSLLRIAAILLLLCSRYGKADVVLDGTIGVEQPLVGPEFLIPAEVGRQQGKNLFHSFRQFNLESDETAVFAGSDSTARIIGRVTGGPSRIDGTLRSNISHADVYLLNASGIEFGPNAKLDLQGDFYASTADKLTFEDGSEFSAERIRPSSLTAAPPKAFGFLGKSTGFIVFDRSKLKLNGFHQTLGFSGTEIYLHGKSLTEKVVLFADEALRIAAVAQGEVRMSPDEFDVSPDTQGGYLRGEYSVIGDSGTYTRYAGEISLHASRMDWQHASVSQVSLNEPGKGVYLETDELKAKASTFSTNSIGTGDSGSFTLKAKHAELLQGSRIDTTAIFDSDGGRIGLDVSDTLRIVDDSIVNASAAPSSTGSAGEIYIQAGSIDLNAGGTISSRTYGSGVGGNITLRSRELNLEKSYIVGGTGPLGLFEPRSNEGNGGHIEINSDKVYANAESFIYNSSTGTGQGGSVAIQTGHFFLNDSILSTESELTVGSDAHGGNISLGANRLLYLDHGMVSATVAGGTGNGGNVTFDAPATVLNHSNITARAEYGNGGNIQLTTKGLFEFSPSIFNASSKFGIDGEITISAPEEALSSIGVLLPPPFLDAGTIRHCASRSVETVSEFVETTAFAAPPSDLSVIPWLEATQ